MNIPTSQLKKVSEYFHHVFSIFWGSFSQFCGLFAYLYCTHFLTYTFSGEVVAHFFVVNSAAVLVGQLLTAGLDGKLYYNAIIAAAGRRQLKESLFVYLSIAAFISLPLAILAPEIFPFPLSTPAFVFFLTTILAQPLIDYFIAYSLSQKNFNLSNVLVAAPWCLRASALFCISYLYPGFSSTQDSETIYLIFSLSSVICSLLGVSYYICKYDYAFPGFRRVFGLVRPDLLLPSRVNALYLSLNIFGLIPYSTAPYILLLLTHEVQDVASIGLFISLLSVANGITSVYNTRFCLPLLFKFVSNRKLPQIPVRIIVYNLPLLVVYACIFSEIKLWDGSILSSLFGQSGYLLYNFIPYLASFAFLSVFSVPAQALLSGGSSLRPSAFVRCISCFVSLIIAMLLVPHSGIVGSLLSLAAFNVTQVIGYIFVFKLAPTLDGIR